MSPICPTAAAACCSCTASGRFARPRRDTPSATAPEDTSTTDTPCSQSLTICAAQREMAALSRPLPLSVSSALPIFTTQVLPLLSRLRLVMRVEHFRFVVIVGGFARGLLLLTPQLAGTLAALARLALHALARGLLGGAEILVLGQAT